MSSPIHALRAHRRRGLPGISYGQRLRRVIEVAIGVAVGVFTADLFVSLAGTGGWQIAAVVIVAMSLALLVGGGPVS